MIPKPPFAKDLALEQEVAEFEKLKPRLKEVWNVLTMAEEEPHTSVVVPSLTLDQSELRKLPGASFYEERLLFLLIRLRNPRARIRVEARHVPVAPGFGPPPGDRQRVRGLELAHVTVDRGRCDEVPKRQVAFDRSEIALAVPPRARLQRLDLAAEVQHAVEGGVEQRLLAEPIAREQRPPCAKIRNREREHAIEPFHACVAVFLIRMNDHFRI